MDNTVIISISISLAVTTAHMSYPRDLHGLRVSGSPSRITGEDIFRTNCAGCHGLDRHGKSPTYPALTEVNEKLTREQVREMIESGRGLMPPFAHLTEDEVRAVISYLFGDSREIIPKRFSTPAQLGHALFQSNCISCHRTTIQDAAPRGIPSEHPMEPAPLAGATRRFDKGQFIKILDSGPGFMPSYSHLSAEEKEALWAYAGSLEGKGEAPRPTMLEMHPQMIEMEHPMGQDAAERGRRTTEAEISREMISDAIHNHIEQGARLNSGYYAVSDPQTDGILLLTLKKIHDDKLSKVDEGLYFACVDMESRDGILYDIDFFLEEQEGELILREVLVHKVDGLPRFDWVYVEGFWQKHFKMDSQNRDPQE